MSPRAFTNKLKGHKLQRDREELMHSELIFAVLGPHMTKAARDKAYNDLEKSAKSKVKAKPKPKHDPIKFWGEIDRKSKLKQ